MLLNGVFAIVCWRKSGALSIFVAAAIVGPLAEGISVHCGAWQYASPTFLGIPMWLPLAWGLATVVVVGVAGTFAKMRAK